jgi:hypothetical protein
MTYRNWQIQTYSTFLGYLAQCTSPVGQAVRTSDCFQTDEQALSYARLMVDYLVDCERSRLTAGHAVAPSCI